MSSKQVSKQSEYYARYNFEIQLKKNAGVTRCKSTIKQLFKGKKKKKDLTNFVVYAAFQVTHRHPALPLLHLWIIAQNLISQPR